MADTQKNMQKRISDRLKLRPDMSAHEFDGGYYYATELKDFARAVGIAVGNYRKNELEELIREFLATGSVPDRKPVAPRKSGEARDELRAENRVVNYVGDRRTKAFLLELVKNRSPGGLRDKSGQWYWLNDWRRKQQEARRSFTYQDLADHLYGLMTTRGRLPQIPSARMNNFITDFRADPANAGVSRADVLKAWEALKRKPGPKTYEEYRKSFKLQG